MEPENPLLLPRMIWQIALAATSVLVAIRAGLYIRDRRRAAAADGEVEQNAASEEVAGSAQGIEKAAEETRDG